MNQSDLEAITCNRRQARVKRIQARHDWFWLNFWLVEKVAQDFLANHKP